MGKIKNKEKGRLKRRFLVTITNLLSMREHIPVSKDILDDLFGMERKTLIILVLLETIILYILLPKIGNMVFVWYGLIMVLTIWRFYNAYSYKKYPNLNSDLVWHEKFVAHIWLTALMFSILALFVMPKLNQYYQLLMFVILVGINSRTVHSLSEDHRTAMGYLLIIMLPLSVEMILLMEHNTLILTFLIILYLFTQMGSILSAYEQSIQLIKQKKQIQKTKALLFEKREILHRFFEQSEDGLFSYDKNMRIIDCNNALVSIFNLERGSIFGSTLYDLDDKYLTSMIKGAMDNMEGKFSGTYINHKGEELWLEIKCSPIYDKNGELSGGIGIVSDKTKEHMMIKDMEYLIYHDTLTTALNRRGFKQFVTEILDRLEDSTYYSLFFYFDLDKFKQANDIFGHDAGDAILKDVVERLKNLSDKIAGITRLGGDEFAFIVPMVATNKEELYRNMDEWIKRIENVILQPYYFNNQEIDIGCSIGVVVIEPGDTNVDELVRNGDLAMLQAKNSKSRVSKFTQNISEKYRKMYEIEKELKNAIKSDEFLIYFQPILYLKTDKVVGAEAVVRWQHPTRGILTPQDFIPFVAGLSLVSQIDSLVIKKVIAHIARWKEEGIFHINYISVNINTKLILHKNFINSVMNSINSYKIEPSQLKLEIDEESLAHSFNEISKVIDRLYIQGIECAIDDFGNLSYLKKLPFTILKIDKEFVHDITMKIDNVLLIQTITTMAHKLKFKIIVGGIETIKQKETIKKIDPNIEYQGELESGPISEEEFKNRYLLTFSDSDGSAINQE